MTFRPQRMTFGAFIAPFHRIGENPTLAMKRDLKVIEMMDDLGYDEAWIGEHHSFARELIADPAVFIAAAAQRTKRIKLGTGVISLPYHHPLMIADQMLMLDHLTEGRAMMGVGPGALASDAYMMGIAPIDQRRRMAESLAAIMKLFQGEIVNMETDWFTLRDARLQMAPFSTPHLPVAVAASFTPTGPTAAGRHGTGLLSVAGADDKAFEQTWGWVEESAAESGQKVDRANWKVVQQVHIAESKEQAINDIRDGYERRAYYGDRLNNTTVAASPLFGGALGTLDELVERGAMIVGTPDDAVKQIQILQERSGGIGGILCFYHEWASWQKTQQSFELFARYVMPHFQGQAETLVENRNWVETDMAKLFNLGPAYLKAFEDAGKEAPEMLKQGIEQMRKAREDAQAKAREIAGTPGQ